MISETKQNTTSQIFHESKEMPSSSKKASLKERTDNFRKSFFLMLYHKSWMKEVLVWLAYNWGVLLKPSVKRRCLDFIILFSQTIVRFDVTILSFDFVLQQNHLLQLFYSKILPIIITFTASAIVVPPSSLSIILNFYAAVAAAALWFWFDSIRN